MKFKTIPGYCGYLISECGIVISTKQIYNSNKIKIDGRSIYIEDLVEKYFLSILNDEQWIQINDRFFISNRGRIARRRSLALHTDYLRVGLRKNGKVEQKFVHSLILKTYVGPRPIGMEGCHKDGDKTNCHLSNLKWGTHKENIADNDVRGERNGYSKLTENQVIEARFLHFNGNIPIYDLSVRYKVAPRTIENAIFGRTWSHIKDFLE